VSDVGLFLVVFRFVAVAIVAYWIVNIAIAYRKPPDWKPTFSRSWPFPRPTRRLWISAGVLGVAAGVALLIFSIWFEGYLAP
jgi:hypothetical protein